MRTIITAVAGFLIATSGAAAADTVFSYHGKLLMPQTGNGVPGAKHLRFQLSGPLPAKGQCSRGLSILEVSDGAYSLKRLLRLGFTVAPGGKAEVCADAGTGALSERLYLQLVLESGGQLEAAYAWKSRDPAKGKSADSVTLFANVEYHVSVAKAGGHLMGQLTPQ